MEKPTITLFMLESLDDKINSGNNDELDADKDWCKIDEVKEDYTNITILKLL